ncbi:MAG TPA: YggS family pyridoxal phosphate-dependent enzyme [Myxococcales bacterium]|nr:YggS family pyridoxal phosphate-dependent enzyme [Myxococcales bacterium]
MTAEAVAERLAQIRRRVEAACARAARPAGAVELLAVSKLQPEGLVREAYAAGQRAFGENYAQELRDKAEHLADLPGLRWHAIGPLQTNKAKYVARAAFAFHALDRVDVARELSRRRTGEALRCYLQVNAGGEESKSGVEPGQVAALLEQVRGLPGLAVEGLMCLPPLATKPEDARPHFRMLRDLARRLGLPGLSMGTTSDFEVAIDEGATVVRVGTAIFGERAPGPA